MRFEVLLINASLGTCTSSRVASWKDNGAHGMGGRRPHPVYRHFMIRGVHLCSTAIINCNC